MRARFATVLVVALVAAVVGVSARPAHAAACMPISVDTKLTLNVVCPGHNGIEILADNITLNLNGYTVDGDDTPGTYGVLLDGRTGVTIKNGTFKDFDSAVRLQNASHDNFLRNLDLLSSNHGFHLVGSANNLITKSTVTGGGAGGVILTTGSNGNDVIRNKFFGNNAGSGVRINSSNNNVIERNRSTENERGIYLLGGSTGNTVEMNRFNSNIVVGVLMVGVNSNFLIKNTVDDNPLGIQLLGIGSGSNQLIKNKVRGSTAGDGIFLDLDSSGNLLEKNMAHDNFDDGIEVDGAGNTLTKNKANKNGDYGFDVAALNTDTGDNSASGNGNPAECTGLAC